MLVLSRKQSQRIKLGDSIVVTVVRVSGDKVRLGIEAPPDMLVLREELEPHPRPAEAGVARRSGHGARNASSRSGSLDTSPLLDNAGPLLDNAGPPDNAGNPPARQAAMSPVA